MLVLSRKSGESIRFPEIDVEIRVIGLRKSKVQLGIEAPREITVSRGEQKQRPQSSSGGNRESERILLELVRLEAAVMDLAERSDPAERTDASQVALEAIERIGGIKRSLQLATKLPARDHDDPKSISELVSVRREVIDQLRTEQSTPDETANSINGADSIECVRQSPARYATPSSDCVVA